MLSFTMVGMALEGHLQASCALSRARYSPRHPRTRGPRLCHASATDSSGWEPPWVTIFDLRERDTFFGDAQQARSGALP